MDEKRKKLIKKSEKVVENRGSVPLAQLDEQIESNNKLDLVIESIKSIPKTEIPPNKETDLTETNALLSSLLEEQLKECKISVKLNLI